MFAKSQKLILNFSCSCNLRRIFVKVKRDTPLSVLADVLRTEEGLGAGQYVLLHWGQRFLADLSTAASLGISSIDDIDVFVSYPVATARCPCLVRVQFQYGSRAVPLIVDRSWHMQHVLDRCSPTEKSPRQRKEQIHL